MISTDYIMQKMAMQGPPPPPPPQVVAMKTVPATPGEAPSEQKKYNDGPGDSKQVQDSLNNLVYALNMHMQGDTEALRQFQQSKVASMQKQAADFSWDKDASPILGSAWQGIQDGSWKKVFTDDIPGTLSAAVDGYQEGGLSGAWAAGKDTAQQKFKDNHPETYDNTVRAVVRNNYGDWVADARDWLNKDSLGLGLKNWQVGAGLLGAGGLYGLYRMFSSSDEEKRRKREMEELRRMRMEMARQNLYRQY